MAVDEEVRLGLDGILLSRPNVTARNMFGGVCYMVYGKMFVILMEGVIALKLHDQLREQALTLAGVSPFRGPLGRPFGQWVQFVILLEEDLPSITPWLDAARDYVESLPPPSSRRRRRSA